MAAFRRQFKNRPPRVYALKLQARFRGLATRQALPPNVRETAAGCGYRARLHKSARDMQTFWRAAHARWLLTQLRAARTIQNPLVRSFLARAALARHRERERKEVLDALTDGGVMFKKHSEGFPPLTKPHIVDKALILQLPARRLAWRSGSLVASERGISLRKLSAIDRGFRASRA